MTEEKSRKYYDEIDISIPDRETKFFDRITKYMKKTKAPYFLGAYILKDCSVRIDLPLGREVTNIILLLNGESKFLDDLCREFPEIAEEVSKR